MLPNNTQVTTTAAPIIAFLAGLLAGKGVFGLDAATWTAIIGSLFGLAATVATAYQTRKTALVTQVANLPEVKTVTLESTPAAAAIAVATPDNVKVGT